MGSYTSKDLIAHAHQQGYTFLTPEAFRVWVHRGLMPQGREVVGAEGKAVRRKEWQDHDLVRLVDLCFLHTLNSRAEALRLGMWLHGHEIEGVRELLLGQIEAMQDLLMGRTWRVQQALSEEQHDQITQHLNEVLETSTVWNDMLYARRPSLHGEDYADVEAVHPDVGRGTPDATLRTFTVPTFTPPEHSPQIGEREAEGEALLSYPNPGIPTRQLALLQHRAGTDLLRMYLGLGVEERETYALPLLLNVVEGATAEDLATARLLVSHQVLEVLHTYSVLPYHVRDRRLDLPRLVAPFKSDYRHLFAAPALFPLTAYLIAAHVYATSDRQRLSFDLGLIALALDRLLKKPDEKRPKCDALLTVLCAVEPCREHP